PRLLAGVRDHYDSDALKEHILEVGMDPSPGKRRLGFGISEKELKAGDSGLQKPHQLSYTHFPPTIVRSIGISTMLPGGSFHRSRPSTTRSAHLPIDIEPFSASS